jgi:hypothetical protein
MNEQDILDDIFGDSKWKDKYPVKWCDSCDTFIIGCTEELCTGTSCNGGSCEKCHSDHLEFNKAKTSPIEYLDDNEKKTYLKIHFLKQYVKDSLVLGEKEINWKRLKDEGRICVEAEELFKKEIDNYVK